MIARSVAALVWTFLLLAMAHPSVSVQAPPNPPALLNQPQVQSQNQPPAAQPAADVRAQRGNISVSGSGEVMVDANITLVQISVEVRSQPLNDKGEWSSDSGDANQFSASASSSASNSIPAPPSFDSVPKGPYPPEQHWQSADSVQRAVSQRSDALIQFLQSAANVKQLKTVGMSLRPLERWHDGQAYNYGWIGTHSLSFEVEAEHAGQYIDEAVRNGATRIDSVSMKPRDEDSEKARSSAIQLAARNALRDAALVLEAMGLPRDSLQVVDIQVDPMQGIVPFRSYDMMMPMAASAESAGGAFSKVVGGQQALNARVTVKLSFDQGKLHLEPQKK